MTGSRCRFLSLSSSGENRSGEPEVLRMSTTWESWVRGMVTMGGSPCLELGRCSLAGSLGLPE